MYIINVSLHKILLTLNTHEDASVTRICIELLRILKISVAILRIKIKMCKKRQKKKKCAKKNKKKKKENKGEEEKI